MRKLLVGFVVVACVVILALAGTVLYLDGDRLRTLAVNYLERTSGVQVDIERVERSVGLTPRIEIAGLRAREPQYSASPLLAAEYVAFEVELWSLLSQPITIRDLVVEAPEIVLPVGDEGLLYWGPAIAELWQRLRRFEWSVHGFRLTDLRTEALHTMRRAEGRLEVRSIEGTMPSPPDLTLHVRGVRADARTRLPIPIAGSVEIDEAALFHTDSELPVRIEAAGRIGGRPLRIAASAGNVLRGVADARRPLRGNVELDRSTLHLDGTVSRGASPHFDLRVNVDVNDLPPMPDSRASFALWDRGDTWNIEGLDAAIGEATLRGQLRIERREPRPLLTGSLHAAGIDVGRGDGRENDRREREGQSQLVAAVAERLGLVDLRLDLDVEELRVLGLPVARVTLQADLADGVLSLAPLNATVLDGTANARLSLDGRQTPPRIELSSMIEGLETSEVSAALGIDRDVFGDVRASIDVTSAGAGLDALAESVGGRITLFMNGGRLSEALAELLDMDIAAMLLRDVDDGETTPIRCAIADFDGAEGVFEARTLIVDTGTVKLVGGGTIDLGERALDLTVNSYSKDFNLLSADAPVHLTGPFRDPRVSAEADEVAESLLIPIEADQAESTDCRALLEQAGEAARNAEESRLR